MSMSDQPTSMQQALDLRPDLGELFTAYYSQLWTDELVDPVLLELCRLRIAQLLGDRSEQMVRYDSAVRAGLGEDKIADLARYSTSARYDQRERVCLNHAEHHLMDVHSITDAQVSAVKEWMSDAEFVAFSVALGMLEGVARLRLTLGLSGPVPEDPLIVAAPAPGRATP